MVQDAVVKAYRRLPEYRGESSFRSWLLAIVANETRNLHRSRRRRDEAGQRAAQASPPAPVDTSVTSTLAAEERRELVAAVQGLAPADRDVLAYRFLLDRSEAETAALLDWPVGTVKSRTSRALAKLRTRLGIAIGVAVAVAAVVAVPPARSAVAHAVARVLRFAGVEVQDSSREPGGAVRVVVPINPRPLPSSHPVSLAEARRLAAFPVGVPAELGQPDEVWVLDQAADGTPRVVSLLFRGGTVRVDEYDGSFDLMFAKIANDVSWTEVREDTALWLAGPHLVTYVDRAGQRHPATSRLAGPTLLWQDGIVGYRIEGVKTAADAVRIAESVTS